MEDLLSNLPGFATHNHVLRTTDDVTDHGTDSTEFDSQEGLEKFAEWMAYVHEAADFYELDRGELEKYNINIWNHEDLYKLYVNRKKFLRFLERLADYEGKIMSNYRIDGQIMPLLKRQITASLTVHPVSLKLKSHATNNQGAIL